MNVLILTKMNASILKKTHESVEDYIKEHHFFDAYAHAFQNNGCQIFVNWEESFFVSSKFKKKFLFIARAYSYIARKIRFNVIDRYFFSKEIARFCNLNKIDVIFTEINAFISPNIIKEYCQNINVTQWYGIFPEMSSQDTLNMLAEYDIIWGPGEFDREKVYFKGIDKLHYVGSTLNDRLYFHDYDQKYAYDIVFVGSVRGAHSNRIEILETIAQKFDNFAFYGSGFENIPDGYKLKTKFKGWADLETTRKLFSSSKIALNLPLNGYDRVIRGYNSRLFEIAACNGAFQVVKKDDKINEFFTPSEDLLTFSDEAELLIILSSLLSQEIDENMIYASYLKSKKYTAHEKVKYMISVLNQKRI